MMYLNYLEPTQRMAELRRLFRSVFSSPEGKIVFTTILEELSYFTQPVSPRQEANRSFATYLVDMTVSHDNTALIEAMLAVPIESPKEESNG